VGKGKGSIGDAFAAKARFQFRLGLASLETSDMLGKYAPHIQDFETIFANMIEDGSYTAEKITAKVPKLFDIILETGDALRGGSSGFAVGQTLPNWGGADGSSRDFDQATMIWLNKLLAGYTGDDLRDLNEQLLYPLLSPQVRTLLDQASSAHALAKVALHETAHTLGPRQTSIPVGGTQTRLHLLGGAAMALLNEELKADTGMGFLAYREFEQGRVSEDWIRIFVATQLAWCLNKIAAALRSGDGNYNGNVYSHIAALQFGMLSDAGLFVFDDEKAYWDINFENGNAAFETALRTTLSHYGPGNGEALAQLLDHYTTGEGSAALHFPRIIETGLHRKPVPSLSYELNGLM